MLVLYLSLISVIRKKHELGIQKALGFTTLQLRNQISLGLLPSVIIGVLLGSLLGATQTNSLMTMVQSAMGIMGANYMVPCSGL